MKDSAEYQKHLIDFFEILLDYRHISGRINKVLREDNNRYSSEAAVIQFSSALVISDWSGPTDNGWEINFPTGVYSNTSKEEYEGEINSFISRQLCLLFAQSFEGFERFLKNSVMVRIEVVPEIRTAI